MDITKRQRRILEIVIREYIELGEPISSHHIQKNFSLGVSPATIRNDLKKLTDLDYLSQPHTSAGRVPSDKGYRYFVNKILEKEEHFKNRNLVREVRKIEKRIKDEITFLRELTGFLATISSSLTYSYLSEHDFYWKDGFEETLHSPEFEDIKKIHSFLNLVKEFENRWYDKLSNELEDQKIKIYIGSEGPFHSEDFSILVSKCSFAGNKKALLAILGPKRMPYDKNIAIFNSLIRLLEDDHE